MNHQDQDKMAELLRQSIRPLDSAPSRDLWPEMLRRLEEKSPPVPWFDWALLAALAVCLCLMPGTIPVLLYHL